MTNCTDRVHESPDWHCIHEIIAPPAPGSLIITYTHMTIYLLPFFLLSRGCSRDPQAELCRRNSQPSAGGEAEAGPGWSPTAAAVMDTMIFL